MKLADATNGGKRLRQIECLRAPIASGFTSLSFRFDDGSRFAFRVDEDTDELRFAEAAEERWHDLRHALPEVSKVYGLRLVWSWEMKNQQGYFDAVQLEFTDDTMSRSLVLQLKVAASMINVFSVEKLVSTGA